MTENNCPTCGCPSSEWGKGDHTRGCLASCPVCGSPHVDEEPVFTERKHFPTLKPYALVTTPTGEQLEVITWPYTEGGTVWVGARTPNAPTTYATYPAMFLERGFIALSDFEDHAEIFASCPPYSWHDGPPDEELDAIYDELLKEMHPNGVPACQLLPAGATTMQHECRISPTGHLQLHDCSSGGPDSGDMNHECLHCGQYWAITLY